MNLNGKLRIGGGEMVKSRFLSSLNEKEREELIKKLLDRQDHKCFICEEYLSPDIHEVDIDHIIPLSQGGRDEENNLAITHRSCNRTKLDSNLEIARVFAKFRKIEKSCIEKKGELPDLSDILNTFGGSKFPFKFQIVDSKIRYSFPQIGDNTVYESYIYVDPLSKFKSFFIELPIEYLFHDPKGINPRKLSRNVIKLIKEFYQKRPQLQVGLARLDTSEKQPKIYIFDGQHKAAAQILLGTRKLLLRVFVNPDIEILTLTNERAGTVLRQIAFNKSVQRQLGSTILAWKIEKYQKDKGLAQDDYSFSERDLMIHFKGEGREIKKFILDYIRWNIINHQDNKLKNYINFGGREKEKPISYSSIEKTFYRLFIFNDVLDIRPFFNEKRENEINNIVKLMNIIAEEILQENYNFNIGIYKIEERIRKIREGKSTEHIPDSHIKAYRLVKEEILYNWLKYVRAIIQTHFLSQGKQVDENKLMQEQFDDVLWENIRKFIRNLANLPIWVDRDRTYLFSKRDYGYWDRIFKTGESPDGIRVLSKGINFLEMIK